MIRKITFLCVIGLFLNNGVFATDCARVHKNIRYYENMVKENPNDVCAYYNLADEYWRKKKIQKTLDCYNDIIKINNQEQEAYVQRAVTYYFYNNRDKAEREFARLVKNIPDSVYGNQELANIYAQIYDYENALKYINKAIELDNNQSFLLVYDRGKIFEEAGMYEKAIQDYTKIINQELKVDDEIYYEFALDSRSNCYEAIGKKQEAEADKQRSKEYYNKNKKRYGIFTQIRWKYIDFRERMYAGKLY